MTSIETTELYAAVLRQLLPAGGYDMAPSTNIAKDIYAHAKALASVDLDAKRLFNVIDDIPADLVDLLILVQHSSPTLLSVLIHLLARQRHFPPTDP